MAAYMRSVTLVFSTERAALLRRKACDYSVEPKRYVRALRRTPVKVLYPDGNGGAERTKSREPKPPPTAPKWPGLQKSTPPPRPRLSPSLVSPGPEEPDLTAPRKDRLGGLRFEKAADGDKRLAKVVSVARSRTFREQQGKILLEGKRLICDALEAGANPQLVFFSRMEKLSELPVDKLKRATLVKVKFEDIRLWSDLVAPQGVIAIFSRPDPKRLTFPQTRHTVPLTLICDNIRDPGNMGAILRSAAAAGCQDVLLTKGCVDAWEPKVLRAAMGAHFRLPVYTNLHWKDVESHLPDDVRIHVADNYWNGRVEDDNDGKKQHAADVNKAPSKPMKAGDYGWVNNKRGLRNKTSYDSDSDSDSDGHSDSDSDKPSSRLSLPHVDAQPYHEQWARRQGPVALVIGGETCGLSLESVELAGKTDGRRLRIPMVAGVDSLNAAMAASIILFEGRRQLLESSSEASGRKGVMAMAKETRRT